MAFPNAHYSEYLDNHEQRLAELQTMSDAEYKLTEEWREAREAAGGAVKRVDGIVWNAPSNKRKTRF